MQRMTHPTSTGASSCGTMMNRSFVPLKTISEFELQLQEAFRASVLDKGATTGVVPAASPSR